MACTTRIFYLVLWPIHGKIAIDCFKYDCNMVLLWNIRNFNI